jgi:hypothetical protein
MHAVQVSHMNHHRHCLEEEDAEGNVARLRWWEALVSGPLFAGALLRCAWEKGSVASRRWMVAEVIAVFVLAIFTWVGCLPAALACTSPYDIMLVHKD